MRDKAVCPYTINLYNVKFIVQTNSSVVHEFDILTVFMEYLVILNRNQKQIHLRFSWTKHIHLAFIH